MIDAQKACFPVTMMCRVLGAAKSGFYAWRGRGPSERERQDRRLAVKVREVHAMSKQRYGSPRVHAELKAQGFDVGRKRVERLMREEGLAGKQPKRFKRTTDSEHALLVAPNALDRNFEPTEPDKSWVVDITYLWTLEGWLFLAVVIDLFSRRVVGWAVADHLRTELAMDALFGAIRRRCPGPGLVHHSDRGVQYAAKEYRRVLDEHGITCSMSRRGNCWDNAVAESFFGRLKVELLTDKVWTTRVEGQRELAEYLDVFYNFRRRHSHNEYRTPAEMEVNAI